MTKEKNVAEYFHFAVLLPVLLKRLHHQSRSPKESRKSNRDAGGRESMSVVGTLSSSLALTQHAQRREELHNLLQFTSPEKVMQHRNLQTLSD